MRVSIVFAALAAVASLAQPGYAQTYRAPVVHGYASPYPDEASGFYCRPMCVADVTPCDPPEYKRADGRCSNPVPGGGGFIR